MLLMVERKILFFALAWRIIDHPPQPKPLELHSPYYCSGPLPHEAGEACAHSGRLPARPLLRLCPDLQPERQPCVCALQDVPPPGGYPAVRTARNLPKGGASAMVMALGSAFIYTWGMYKIIKANQTRRCRAPPPWRCAGGLCSPPELCGARRQGVEA